MSADANSFRPADEKANILAKILRRLQAAGIGAGAAQPPKQGDTFTVLERKILQQIANSP